QLFFFYMQRLPPRPTVFPYTTLFRSLSMADLPLLLRTLTPARWALLERLREAGKLSIYELAKRLDRDYKNVHTDVTALVKIGLIDRKSTRLNSSHSQISYAVFCLKKK